MPSFQRSMRIPRASALKSAVDYGTILHGNNKDGFQMRISILALFTYCSWLGASPRDIDIPTFEKELALAEAYDPNRPPVDVDKNRDTAVAHYIEALALRPNHPDNMAIEYEVGVLLMMVANRDLGQATFPPEAHPFLERAAHDYTDYYNDYYESSRPNTEGPISRQGMMVHAAILSGVMKEKPEDARQDYDLAMQYLNITIQQRRQEWSSLPPPAPKVDDSAVLRVSPDINRGYESRVAEWEDAQKAVESGEVFPEGSKNLLFAETAVNLYMSSFGDDVPPESVRSLMEPILKKYPGTPMARFAQNFIDNADKAMRDGKKRDVDPARSTVMPLTEEAAKVDEGEVAVSTTNDVAVSPSLPEAPPPAKPQTSPGPTPSGPGTGMNWLRWGAVLGVIMVIAVGIVRRRAVH
jgi:hypothetical protein